MPIIKLFAMSTPGLVGVILMGGKSERMGQDKSQMVYHDQIQYRWVLEMLSKVCPQTVLSCNTQQAERLTGLPVVIDRYPGRGPMAGIASVMEAYPGNALLTVPCDLPFLDVLTLQNLASKRNPQKMATTCLNHDSGKLEPLLTIWEPPAWTIISNRFAKNELSVYRCLQEINPEIISGTDPAVFQNVNTPDDYFQVCENLQKNNRLQNE